MSASEAETIWMSSSAMKKPMPITAKAKIFCPSDSSDGGTTPADRGAGPGRR